MSTLAPVAEKLGKLLRLLTSDRDGEVLAAARAIVRTLSSANLSIYDLADRIDMSVANGKTFTEQQVIEIYQRGVEDGLRKADEKRFNSGEEFRNTDGSISWHGIAIFCLERIDCLDARHHQFVRDMAARTVSWEPTEKQGKYLKSLYFQSGGKP
jgi:hypothetical protein